MNKSLLMKAAIPLAVVAFVISVVALTNDGVGSKYKEGDRIGKIMSSAEPDAFVQVSLDFGQADPEHEIEHVYQVLEQLKGIAKVEMDLKAKTLVVSYDSGTLPEKQVVSALASTGYARRK